MLKPIPDSNNNYVEKFMDTQGGQSFTLNSTGEENYTVGSCCTYHLTRIQHLRKNGETMQRKVPSILFRWFNQLNPTLDTETFTKEQEDLLFSEQNRIGNKWAKICGIFPNRSDNFIKNHFYSTFRKAYRKVNRELLVLKGKEIKPIKNVIINRILSCAQQKFQQNTDTNPKVIELAIEIKRRLLPFARMKSLEKNQEDDIIRLMELINYFKNTQGNITKKKIPKKRKSVFMFAQGEEDENFQKNTSKRRTFNHSSSDDDNSVEIQPKIKVELNQEIDFLINQTQTSYPKDNKNTFLNYSNHSTHSTPSNCSQIIVPSQSQQTVSQLIPNQNFSPYPKPNAQGIFLGYVPIFLNPETYTHFLPNGFALQPHQLHGLFSNTGVPPMMMPPRMPHPSMYTTPHPHPQPDVKIQSILI